MDRAEPVALSVAIPAYREAENLKLLLPRLLDTLDATVPSHEVLIVDTEAPLDDTKQVADGFAARGVRWLARRHGDSFGSAVRTGIAASRGAHVVFMDGDGSHDPEFIAELYARRDEADIVVASRYVAGGGTENAWLTKMMSLAVNLTYRVFFAIDCKDMSNSFKLYRGDLIRGLELRSDNFDIIEEILIEAKRQHRRLTIAEVPYVFKKRIHGETKRRLLAFAVTFAWTLVRLKFRR